MDYDYSREDTASYNGDTVIQDTRLRGLAGDDLCSANNDSDIGLDLLSEQRQHCTYNNKLSFLS